MPINGPLGRLCLRLKVVVLTTVIVVFFPIIGSAFYISLGIAWLRERLNWHLLRSRGLLFASGYAAAAALLRSQFPGNSATPWFSAIFLMGIVLAAYWFSWRSAALLLAIALAQLARGAAALPGYLVVSFSLVSALSIVAAARMKTDRQPQKAASLRLGPAAGAGMGD